MDAALTSYTKAVIVFPTMELLHICLRGSGNVKSWLIYIILQAVQQNNFPAKEKALIKSNKNM